MENLIEEVKKIKIAASVPPPATLNKHVDGVGSVYVFDIRPTGAFAFRYDVELTQLGKTNKSLTKGGGDDGKNGLLRGVCFALIRHVHQATQGFGNEVHFVYDNRKNLFTNKQIRSLSLEIDSASVKGFVAGQKVSDFLRNSPVMVEIKPCQTDKFELDLNDLGSSVSRHPSDPPPDRSLRTFLEMLTTQPFINAETHDVVGAGRLFKRQICKELEQAPGIVTREGIAKGVRIIDNGGQPKAALVADVKTCAFFANKNLEDIVNGMLQQKRTNRNDPGQMDRFWVEFSRLFRGVSGYLTYAPSRVIVIDSISQRKMNDISFEVDGQAMSMVDFFRVKKDIRINGQLPAVRQQKDRETLFPLSCIVILPSQRLPLDKMADYVSRELLNANTTHPSKRYADIEAEVRKIGTGASNEFMVKFGVKLVGGKNDIKIGIHEMPKIKFGDGGQQTFKDRINPAVRFLETSDRVKNWVVGYPRQINDQDVRAFVEQILSMGRKRGMKLSNPQFECIEMDSLDGRMQQLRQEKDVHFLMYIDKKFAKSHSILKLNEKRFGLLTQHVTFEVASKARAMTLSNVLNKMNMKMFGFNYLPIFPQITKGKLNMDSGDLLVVGIDTSRPPKATAYDRYKLCSKGLAELTSEEPMTVGICANYLKNPYKFCGDYYFQPCTQDQLQKQMLEYKFGWILDKVQKNRGKMPSVVFIIRDGISEGLVPKNAHSEFQAYVDACKKAVPNWSPKFVYCIVDKKHNKRFFVKSGQQVENTEPGSVVDSKFTRIDIHEFWLQSHVPLKGTTKIPQYVFPVNQVMANNNELQSFLLSLCCNWQIVTLAPGLPTPVRQAAELAKRGRANFNELKRTPKFIPRFEDTDQINYTVLNSRLCYNGHILADTRFNA
ncbi:hypothetical protein niasHS_005603 [Heterodera schachtii]|uniref:Piwi domain-containing protein n=1 Tax=Heterodera schachtii TaxID=97005 RepID=A0ABD2JZN0_HETSC